MPENGGLKSEKLYWNICTMSDDIPLVEPKRPKIGDYVRSGSCLGEPQVMTNHIFLS